MPDSKEGWWDKIITYSGNERQLWLEESGDRDSADKSTLGLDKPMARAAESYATVAGTVTLRKELLQRRIIKMCMPPLSRLSAGHKATAGEPFNHEIVFGRVNEVLAKS